MTPTPDASPSPRRTPDTAAPPSHQPLDREALIRALAAVRADSQREPETYLRDTVVPHGGE